MKASMLIVNDDPDLISAINAILYSHDYHVVDASGKREALLLLRSFMPDLIILDLTSEEEHENFELAAHLRKYNPRTRVLILTGPGDFTGIHLGSQATSDEWLPADGYLEKPFSPAALISKVEEIIHDPK